MNPRDKHKEIYRKVVVAEILFSAKCSECEKKFSGKDRMKVLGDLWEHIGDEHI